MATIPDIKIRGIRTPIPSGYVLGRTQAGHGDVHLIPIDKVGGVSGVSGGGGGGGGGGSAGSGAGGGAGASTGSGSSGGTGGGIGGISNTIAISEVTAIAVAAMGLAASNAGGDGGDGGDGGGDFIPLKGNDGAPGTGPSLVVNDKGSVGTGTVTFSYADGTKQKLTVTGSLTIAYSNWPASGTYGEIEVMLVNGAAGTITWPTVSWLKGDGTNSTTFSSMGVTLYSSGVNWVIVWTVDGGTTLYGGAA